MATKSAIGRMMQEAQNRLDGAMQALSEALGVAPLDLSRIRDRDPAYERAAQVEALATWAEALAGNVYSLVPGVEDETSDLVDERDRLSDRLAVVHLVLESLLRQQTKAALEQFAADFGLEMDGSAKKEAMVTALAEQLTGKRIEFVPEGDTPADLEPPVRSGAGYEPHEIPDGMVARIVDVEETT